MMGDVVEPQIGFPGSVVGQSLLAVVMADVRCVGHMAVYFLFGGPTSTTTGGLHGRCARLASIP